MIAEVQKATLFKTISLTIMFVLLSDPMTVLFPTK